MLVAVLGPRIQRAAPGAAANDPPPRPPPPPPPGPASARGALVAAFGKSSCSPACHGTPVTSSRQHWHGRCPQPRAVVFLDANTLAEKPPAKSTGSCHTTTARPWHRFRPISCPGHFDVNVWPAMRNPPGDRPSPLPGRAHGEMPKHLMRAPEAHGIHATGFLKFPGGATSPTEQHLLCVAAACRPARGRRGWCVCAHDKRARARVCVCVRGGGGLSEQGYSRDPPTRALASCVALGPGLGLCSCSGFISSDIAAL